MNQNRTYQIIVEHEEELDRLMCDSARIYNQTLYQLRQSYFDSIKNQKPFVCYNITQLYHIVKKSDSFANSNISAQSKQAAIQLAFYSWKSFIAASTSYKKDFKKFLGKPKPPKYNKNEFGVATITSQTLNIKGLKENQIKLPKTEYIITFPEWIKRESIRCVRLVPFYDKVKIEIVYRKEVDCILLNSDNAIALDLGVNNLMAITSNNQCFSCVVNGRILKSINQYYNKTIAELSSILERCNHQKSSKRIQNLFRKRHNQVKDYLHKASRRVIDICLLKDIGTIVIGHNKGWKQECNMGKRNNQNFVQIPFNTLISMIKYKAEEVGIKVIVVEESYTSKTDHLVLEEMKHIDNRKNKRLKRGLFKSDYNGRIINADINGSIGILRKAKVITDRDIISLRDRGDLSSPLKFNL